MSRTVLVLTATGTTGQHVVAALARRGIAARAATRRPEAVDFPAPIEAVHFDLDDPSTWDAALSGVDALYFAIPPHRPDEVAVSQALIDRARALGVERFVKLSALGVEQQPESSHRQVERHIEASGARWVHLRPTFFMDNFLTFYGEGIVERGQIALPAGKGKTSFVAAADIGELAATALLGDAHAEEWPITGSEDLDHDDVARQIAAAIGRDVRYVDISPEAHAEGMRANGMPEHGVQTMSSLYAAVRHGLVEGTVDTVEQVLSRPPQRFSEWAREHASAWQ